MSFILNVQKQACKEVDFLILKKAKNDQATSEEWEKWVCFRNNPRHAHSNAVKRTHTYTQIDTLIHTQLIAEKLYNKITRYFFFSWDGWLTQWSKSKKNSNIKNTECIIDTYFSVIFDPFWFSAKWICWSLKSNRKVKLNLSLFLKHNVATTTTTTTTLIISTTLLKNSFDWMFSAGEFSTTAKAIQRFWKRFHHPLMKSG